MARLPEMKPSSWALNPRTTRVRAIARTRVVEAVAKIATRMPFCYRHRLADPFLQASIKRMGILTPVFVTGGDRPTVIAGHRRLHAARVLKIKTVPVRVTGEMKPKDAFLLNLVSNWKQTCSDTDRARALGMATGPLGFSEADTIRLIMPFLGLPEDKALLSFYRKIDECPVPVKDLIEGGQLPLRGITFLLKFSERDKVCFARKICARARLTSSQLLQVGEWLADLLKVTGKDLETILREHKVLDGLDVPGMDPRTKADRLFAAIKRVRFPGYTQYLEAFEERRAGVLRDARELRLEPVQGFEEPGFELHARVRTPAELDRLLRRITEKRSALNSLFEIVL